jgi:hypothetical protein
LTLQLILFAKETKRYCYNCICKRWKWNYYWNSDSATVTIDEQSVPTDLTGTTAIAENAAGVATLTATLSTATTEATLVSLEYTGTATNGTDYVASSVISILLVI